MEEMLLFSEYIILPFPRYFHKELYSLKITKKMFEIKSQMWIMKNFMT
jgi:hypothetical protein